MILKDNIVISENSDSSLVLRNIEQKDQNMLRQWKNKNRDYFFFKDEINAEMQQIWFEKYLNDSNNFLFAVEYNMTLIGCMGFKVTPEGADVYNIILGNDSFAKSGIMSKAMKIMCSYILEIGIDKVFLKVLQSNKIAYEWYLKNSFSKKYSSEDYHFLELDMKNFDRCKIDIVCKNA